MVYALIIWFMTLFVTGHWGWGLLFMYLYWLYVDATNERP